MPKGVSPPGFSVEEVRGKDNVERLGDVVVNLLKSFPIRLLEECEAEREAERWRLLKKLLIGSATPERIFFLGSLGFCGLSFFMLVVRDDESCAAVCGSIVQIQRFAGPHSRALSSLACISSLPTLFRTQASSPECKPTFFLFLSFIFAEDLSGLT